MAQRLAQVETITDAVLTSNVTDLVDRVKMNEAKAAVESGRIDKLKPRELRWLIDWRRLCPR